MANTRFVLAAIATFAAGAWLYKYFKGDSRGRSSNNYNRQYYHYDTPRYICDDYWDDYYQEHSYYDYSYDDYDWYDEQINYDNEENVNKQNVSAIGKNANTVTQKRKRSKKRKNIKNKAVECTICLNSVQDRKKRLLCGHFFHVRCIERWFLEERSCPICRRSVI